MRPRKLQPSTARNVVRQLDSTLEHASVPIRPARGWVHAIRTALGMTHAQLARRIGITRQSVASLEANEVRWTASLGSLQRAADALGCDLQYTLVPRKPLAEMLLRRARHKAEGRLRRVNVSQGLEASAVPDSAMATAVEDLATDLVRERPGDFWSD